MWRIVFVFFKIVVKFGFNSIGSISPKISFLCLSFGFMILTLRAHEVLLCEEKPIRKGKMIRFKASEVYHEVTYEI